jgi:hypothetical protein
MDLLELFCSNLKKPTKELNDAYLFLIKKIEKSLNELGLRAHKITLYKPFTGDLYTAEAEWNGINDYDLRLGPKLSWDAIRPSLYRVHSEITKLYNLAKEDADKSDDDKRLEQIKNFIADKRVQKKPSENEKVQKMEILHKYEDKPQKQKIKLSDHRLSFDGETAELQIGDFQPVSFPPYKNEHYALRKLFSQKKNEPVDWQEVYEAMTSTKSDTINKVEIEKQKKTVKDTVRAINQRIKEVGGVDTDLLKWDIKCVKRLY